MNTQKVLIGLAILVVLVLGVSFPRGNSVIERVIQAGSATGPDTFFPEESHNGAKFAFYKQSFAPSTTSICSLKLTATTSINFIKINNTVATGTALTYRIATSTTGNTATTTVLMSPATSASETDSFIYHGKSGDVIFPNTWVNISFEGVSGVSSGSGVSGTCEIDTLPY